MKVKKMKGTRIYTALSVYYTLCSKLFISIIPLIFSSSYYNADSRDKGY